MTSESMVTGRRSTVAAAIGTALAAYAGGAHALEFEFPHRPPERVHYVGPMVLESRTDRPQTAADRAELGAVLARCRRAGGGRTLIYAGFGSAFSTDRALLRRLLGTAAARPDWDLVVSLGGRLAPFHAHQRGRVLWRGGQDRARSVRWR